MHVDPAIAGRRLDLSLCREQNHKRGGSGAGRCAQLRLAKPRTSYPKIRLCDLRPGTGQYTHVRRELLGSDANRLRAWDATPRSLEISDSNISYAHARIKNGPSADGD